MISRKSICKNIVFIGLLSVGLCGCGGNTTNNSTKQSKDIADTVEVLTEEPEPSYETTVSTEKTDYPDESLDIVRNSYRTVGNQKGEFEFNLKGRLPQKGYTSYTDTLRAEIISTITGKYSLDVESSADKLFEEMKKDYDTVEMSDEWVFNKTYSIATELKPIYKGYATGVVNMNTYDGGAHGYYCTVITVVDTLTSKMVQIKDVVKKKNEMTTKIKKRLCQMFNIKSEKDLADEFFVDMIEPSPTFYFDKDSLFFIYNPYDIAAYAVGQIEVGLSISDVEGIIYDDVYRKLKQ